MFIGVWVLLYYLLNLLTTCYLLVCFQSGRRAFWGKNMGGQFWNWKYCIFLECLETIATSWGTNEYGKCVFDFIHTCFSFVILNQHLALFPCIIANRICYKYLLESQYWHVFGEWWTCITCNVNEMQFQRHADASHRLRWSTPSSLHTPNPPWQNPTLVNSLFTQLSDVVRAPRLLIAS